METMCVRFDDLSQGGSGSFGLTGRTDSFIARRIEDVVPVLRAAEAAAHGGSWVAGFVTYEAAPALNPVLAVRPSGLHDPMRDLPLAKFQAFSNRVELDEIDSVEVPAGAYNVSAWSPDSSRRDYRDSLAMTGRAIMSGEISRGKHTFRLHAAFSGDPAALYRDLLMSQRGPHAACVDAGRFRLVSASPERFFRRTGETLTMRPVLASVRRGRWLEEDERLAAMLMADGEASYSNRAVIKEMETELAELGDLISVSGESRLAVERLETLWHLTAELEVRLNPGTDLIRIFEALFPPVSVTGVPKPEAMDLVALTEDTPRGAYCGAIGFLAPPGADGPDASFGVAVRTVVVDQDEGVAEYGVGTAITNSSDVISAYEEARLKAKILVDRRPEFQVREEMRVEDGSVPHLESKLNDLLASARYFGFDVANHDVETIYADAVANAGANCRLTVLMGRDGAITTEMSELPTWSPGFDEADVLFGVIAEHSVSTDNVFLFHKTTDDRLKDTLARQYPDVDVVVLVNQLDEVAGTLRGSIVVTIDGEWLTPPRDCGATTGVLRSELLAAGTITERVITRNQLQRAERVAVVDDIHGWRRIDLLG